MFPPNENRNEGTFGCSPGTNTGTRVRSHVPPERGHIRQNHPFMIPPFYLPVIVKHKNDLPKRSSPCFSRVFCPEDGFSKMTDRTEGVSSPSSARGFELFLTML